MSLRCALFLATGVGVFAGPAYTANAGSGDAAELSEVVVTAQKREETLTKVPISETVLSQSQLQDLGVVNLPDLVSNVPSVQMKTLGFTDAIQISIRGTSNTDFNEAGNPAVATYIDGYYIGRSEGLTGALYDLQHVEILRGPQGTLYGRNSTGGNVNISTADPERMFDAAADISYGNYNDLQTHAMVNVPVTDTLAIRGAIMTHQSDGYYNTLGTTYRGYGVANDRAGRVTLLWTPMENFSWRLSADDFVSNGTPGLDIEIGPNGKPASGLPVFTQPTLDHLEPSDHLENFMVRSRMQLQLSDKLSIAYIAGYQDVRMTAQAAVGPNAPNGFDSLRRDPFSSYSHELDLNFDTRLVQNTFGASYFHQSDTSPDAYHFFKIQSTFGIPVPDVVTTKAWGVFDQASFRLSDSLRLIAGVRYSSEEQAAAGALIYLCPLDLYPNVPLRDLSHTFGPGCSTSTVVPAAGKWSNVNWKAALQYDLSDTASAYLSATTGFKSGGPNVGFNIPLPNFAPEKVNNYEAGFKARFLDNTLRLNTAVFFENYTDLQVTQVSSTTYSTITENAAGAHIYGTEIEGEWRASKHDQVSGFLNYLHATYTRYNNAVDQLDGRIYPSLSGSYLPNAPVFSVQLRYAHDFDLPGGAKLTPALTAYWQAKNYLREFNLPIDRVDSYSKTGATVTYEDSGGHWRLQAYGQNLENRIVRQSGYTVLNTYFSNFDAPRTYGVRLSYRY